MTVTQPTGAVQQLVHLVPSMHVSSWATILLSMSLEATSLLGVMASISSMNMMHGELVCRDGAMVQDRLGLI